MTVLRRSLRNDPDKTLCPFYVNLNVVDKHVVYTSVIRCQFGNIYTEVTRTFRVLLRNLRSQGVEGMGQSSE